MTALIGVTTQRASRLGLPRRTVAAAALGFALLAVAGREARADSYKDEKLGFSFNAPGKWKQMPIATDEHWVVAEFQCPRQFETSDAKTNSWTYHQPKLDVVIIPNSAAEQKGAEVTKTGNKIVVKQQAPWSDLKEYLDKTVQDSRIGGYFFSKEEEQKVGNMKVMFYEVTIDKMTSSYNNAPRKYFGWAFYYEDAIYGLVGDALVKFEDKVKPDLDAAVKSFKIFTRTGTLPGTEFTPGEGGDVVVKEDPKKEHLTDEELKKRRMDAYSQRLAKIKNSLPDGWKIKDSENFTAVTHCDDKFTKEVLDHAEALRAWFDQNLGFVGSGYAGKIIIRVCADDNERSAMYNSRSWTLDNCEVVTGQDKNGWFENKLSQLNREVYGIWLTDRNRELAWHMPPWIAWGLSECISGAVSKGKKITDFKASTWDNVMIGNLRRADKLLPARSFFSMGWEEMGKDYENMRQTEYFVRYLLIGPAHSNAKYKNLLGDYIKNLAILLDEADDAKPKDEKEPQNEEEEAALRRRKSEEWKANAQETLKKLIDKTFPNWQDKDWTQFNNSYWKELGV